ncbi:MAG TPA: VOC family protein [Acidimicrobiia bacterium]|nr:VOC family protein [Acidimicrobiia bacterium]
MKLDHVAIAVSDHRPVLRQLTGELGALVLSGGTPQGAGFRAMQIRLGRGEAGMTVEVLEPFQPENNDFLARFIDATGGGVHHVTFKTDDIVVERERLRALGVEPVGVDFAGGWKEMFIHPRDGQGTVIQIAQSDLVELAMSEWLDGLPETLVSFDGTEPWWDVGTVLEGRAVATLQRVVIATPDPASGVAFYRDVLEGEAEGHTIIWNGGEILLEAAEGGPRVDRLEIVGHPSIEIGTVRFLGL